MGTENMRPSWAAHWHIMMAYEATTLRCCRRERGKTGFVAHLASTTRKRLPKTRDVTKRERVMG